MNTFGPFVASIWIFSLDNNKKVWKLELTYLEIELSNNVEHKDAIFDSREDVALFAF